MANYIIKYGDTLGNIAKQNNTTVNDLIRLNPQITDPNKISAGGTLNLAGATVQPVSTTNQQNIIAKPYQPDAPTQTIQPTTVQNTQTAPTIAEKASLIPNIPTDPAISEYYNQQKDLINSPVDDKALRDEIRQRYNSQFDSLRIAAAQKIASEKKLGEGRLGSARALQSRSGTLGSNFASAENDQIDRGTQDIINATNAETDAKIAMLMGQSEKDYSDQIAAQKEAKRKGADEYIKYLETRDSQRSEKASNLAKLFAAQNTDVGNLSTSDIKKLEDVYGVDLNSFKAMIAEQKNKINKDALFELGDGQSKYVYDPITGEAKLIAENTKNFAPSKYNSGGGVVSSGGTVSSGTSKAVSTRSQVGVSGLSKQTPNSNAQLSYDDPNYLTQVITSSRGKKTLTGEQEKPLTTAMDVLGQVGVVSNMVKNANTGPIIGILRSNNPYDTKAQEIKTAVTALVPRLARGIYGEVGVLTDSDVERYTKTIANLKSTDDVNKAVMAMTLDLVGKSMGNRLESYAAAGRDVYGYLNIYKRTTNQVNKLKSELESKAGPSTSVSNISVKSRDGRVISIPKDKLSAALKAGYTQVK